jgi:hypothetical protein
MMMRRRKRRRRRRRKRMLVCMYQRFAVTPHIDPTGGHSQCLKH